MEQFQINLVRKIDKYIKIRGMSYKYLYKNSGCCLDRVSTRSNISLKKLFKLSKILDIDIRNFLMFYDSIYIFNSSFETFEEFSIFLTNRLKQFRVDKGLTALDIADKLGGIHINNIYRIENSKDGLVLKRFYDYLDVINVSVDEFFLKDEEYEIKRKSKIKEITIDDFFNRLYELEEILNTYLPDSLTINTRYFPTVFKFLKICKILKIYPKDFFDFDKKEFNNLNTFEIEKNIDIIICKIKFNLNLKLDSVFYFCIENSLEIVDFFDDTKVLDNINQMISSLAYL